MSEQGRKFDNGKLRYDLIPVLAQEEVVKVVTLGAEKYDPENWKRVPEGRRRYYAAAMRHMEAWRKGEKQDEIGTHHIANAISNLMFILEKELRDWGDVEGDYEENTLQGIKELITSGKHSLCEGMVVQGSSISPADKSNPLKPWVPDGSGEWIEYDGSGQPVSDSTVVDVLQANERDDPSRFQSLPERAGTWNWDVWGKGADIVAYKVCKD